MISKFIKEVENAFVSRCFEFSSLPMDEALVEYGGLKKFSHAFIISITNKNGTFPTMNETDNPCLIYSRLANKAITELSTKKNIKTYSFTMYRHSNKKQIIFLCGLI